MDYHDFPPLFGTPYALLDYALKQILNAIKPSQVDHTKRSEVINHFGALVASIESLRDATVHPFGSFVSNLYSKWGDVDISIEPSSSLVSPASKGRKQKLLKDILRALHRRGWFQVQFIPQARVPVLIFQSKYPDISCDISIGNLVGQIKSKIMLWMTEIDERFRDLVLLIKEWAKAQNINDPKSGTLNSYSLSLLVIFHFQTCNPPILPPLKEIYGGNIIDDLTGMRSVVERRIQEACNTSITRFKYQSRRQVNRSSLADLFILFFQKFSGIEIRSPNYVVCTFTGQWEHIRSHAKWTEKNYKLFIEDPFEQPDNAARAVGANQLSQISEAFRRTYHMLSSLTVSSDPSSVIASLVRPHISSTLGIRTPNSRHGTFGGFSPYTQSANGPTTHVRYQQSHPTWTTLVQQQAGVGTSAQPKQGWRPRN